MLDAPSVNITSGGIIIPAGSTLYFDWRLNITLVTQYITVRGSLVIGTESCPFYNAASITLINGTYADKTVDVTVVGRKFIAVASGGTIELHGAKGKYFDSNRLTFS
jgi:hypothetical protein